jgi:hypothetical protein
MSPTTAEQVATPLHDGRDISFGHATEAVGTGSHLQRRIGNGNIVEVQMQGDRARQHLERWRDVKRSVLARPGPETFDVHPLYDSDCPILMPTKSPIGTRRLVEKDGSYRTTRLVQDGSRHGTDRSLAVQKRAQVGNTKQPYPDLIRRLARQSEQDSRQSRSVNGGAMELRTVPLVLQGTPPQLM